jgi:hypothetical protein
MPKKVELWQSLNGHNYISKEEAIVGDIEHEFGYELGDMQNLCNTEIIERILERWDVLKEIKERIRE